MRIDLIGQAIIALVELAEDNGFDWSRIVVNRAQDQANVRLEREVMHNGMPKLVRFEYRAYINNDRVEYDA